MKHDPKNTRASQRQPVSAVVNLLGPEGQRHLGFACDISLGGLGLVAISPVQEEGLLPLQIKFPSGNSHLHLSAKVVHQRYQMSQGAYALGMVWTDLAQKQQEALIDLLRLVKLFHVSPNPLK